MRQLYVGQAFDVHAKTVVLRGNFDASGLQILDRVVQPMVAELELEGPTAQGQPQELMAEADAGQGIVVDQKRGGVDQIGQGRRIARAGGYFRQGLFPEASQAIDKVSEALSVSLEIDLPEAARARAAAYVITTTEGAALHLRVDAVQRLSQFCQAAFHKVQLLGHLFQRR